MKNKIIFTAVFIILALFFYSPALANASDVNLTIRDGNTIVFSDIIPFPAQTVELNDIDGNPHTIDEGSVLAVLNDADVMSPDFSISNLTYYSSFGSLYLKCITHSAGEKCDNWQYTVNDIYPSSGMDTNILSGGENVYIYFGPQHKLSLNSNSINTSETLIVKTEDYDYQNDSWTTRTGITVGVTQPDPDNPWSPLEVQTSPVDASGEAVFSEIPEGSYNVGIREDFYFPTEALTVTVPPPIHHSSGGYRSPTIVSIPVKQTFDTKRAFEFLSSQQKEDGSFGEDIYTDWTALAFSSNDEHKDQKDKLIKYLSENKPKGELLTDHERHAIALVALGLNPYNTNNENYIKKITDSFDGKQFGDANEDNDDIFALIVLQNAGFTQEEKIISENISYILSKQRKDGSWDESIDMTGAGMEALSNYKEIPEVKNALERAKNFMKQSQKDDGGFENVSSTAWAMQGILAIGEKIEDWTKNSNSPLDYLAEKQDTDGGIKNTNLESKIWETSYSLASLSGKTWNQIMQKFEKPEIEIIPIETKPVLVNKINDSHQSTFIKKIEKFQKPKPVIEEKNSSSTQQVDPSPVKKQSWLKRFIGKILNIFN
ncbi:terpene cyclase/mutase family protein [Patescibacteria group bacterium]|nr:terpene cyclase/mutase family protein [Patescibacteria group bacterium]MBU1728011.1 terpene cyclase/mutase family protein [Patescibacteria group bacterium]